MPRLSPGPAGLTEVSDVRYDTAVFDLDGILLKDGMMTSDGRKAVELLLEKGFHVVYSSGKNYWYTTGGLAFSNLLRDDTIVMAENGGIIYFPRSMKKVTLGKGRQDIDIVSREYIGRHCIYENGDLLLKGSRTPLWQEPKETIFTLFPMDVSMIPSIKDDIEGIIRDNGLKLYTVDHSDAVDTVPMGQDKGAALSYLSNIRKIRLESTVVFGDGNNDREMLEKAALPVTVDNANKDIKKLVRKMGGVVSKGSYGTGVLEAAELILAD